MGRAFVALSGDGSSPFWNPAATSSLDRTELDIFHSTLFADTKYDYLGLSHPLWAVGVFSTSLARIGISDIERRDSYNRPGSNFSSSQTHIGLSFARRIGFGLSGGMTAKILMVDIADFTDTGAGADLGFQYTPTFARFLTLGAFYSDLISPKIKLVSVEEGNNTISNYGISSNNRLSKNINSVISLALETSTGRSSKFKAGAEMGFQNQYFLRAGAYDSQPTFGAGLILKGIRLDYAFENIEHFGGSHRISFGFAFGKSVLKTEIDRRDKIVEEERVIWESAASDQTDSLVIELISQGNQSRDANKYDEAMLFYSKAAGLSDNPEPLEAMADSMKANIISQALSRSSDEKLQEMVGARIESALEDHKQGRYGYAISKYNLLLEIDPGNSTIEELLKSSKDAKDEAFEQRQKAARNYQNAGNIPEAISAWNLVLALEPTDTNAKRQISILKNNLRVNDLVTSAVGAMNRGAYVDAVNILSQAKKLSPGDDTILSLLIQARAKSSPITNLEDIKANTDHWAIYISGLEAYQSSDYRSALEIWRELLDNFPNNPDLEKNIDQAVQRLSAEGGNR